QTVTVAADATRPGTVEGNVITGVTPITSTSTVEISTAMQALQLPFDAGAVAHLRVNTASDELQLVGQDGRPVRHGLQDGTALYYQSSAIANGDVGAYGLINTAPGTTNPEQGTQYTARVLDEYRFQLELAGTVVQLTDAIFYSGDSLNGLEINTHDVSTTTTEVKLVGTTEVVSGYEWYTYTLNLLQDAFYNPQTGAIAESFIPGISFEINNINWGSAEEPTSSKPWGLYSPAQRQAVLDSLGYLPFYAIDVHNVQKVTNNNGKLTSVAVGNPWFNEPQSLVVPTSGPFAGKAIVGPASALTDYYSAVNDNAPEVTQGLTLGGDSIVATNAVDQEVTGLTLEAWVWLDAAGSNDGEILKTYLPLPGSSDPNLQQFTLYITGGKLALYSFVYSINEAAVIGDQVLPRNQWVHVAATISPDGGYYTGTTKLYINGVSDAISGLPISYQNFTNKINSLSILTTNERPSSLTGAIREVKAWTKARTAAEVVQDMSQMPGGPDSGIAYWFPLDGSLDSGIPGAAAGIATNGTPQFTEKEGINDQTGKWNEKVGYSQFQANVKYEQKQAALKSTTLSQKILNPYSPEVYTMTGDVLSANSTTSGATWEVSYAGGGVEEISVQRNRTATQEVNFTTDTPFTTVEQTTNPPYWVDNIHRDYHFYDPANPDVYGIGRGL
ncbi:MAG: LamG domain-containing protein, partial [Planctomycetes bacterium]|nr:LamG domain-containing protein [Planctomycetota bacterium]